MKTSIIQDNLCLTSCHNRFGHEIPVYDDGYGPLWIHRDSMGISGIVRAESWEDAYSICEDEFFPAATEDESEWIAEYGKEYMENACWQESYGFRGNARKEADGTLSTIYEKDLNGDSLERLTNKLLNALELTLVLTGEDEIEN